MITPADAATELLKRRRMRDTLVGFAEGIEIPSAPVSDDPDETVFLPVGSTIPAHHRLVYAAAQECMETDYGRLLVMMPPGTGKSIACSSVAPAWFIGKNPGARVILASYATEIAKKHSRKARQIVRQDVYRGAFGGSLSKETSAAEMWSVNFSGGRPQSEFMAGGLLSGLTGNRAAGVIGDDFLAGREAADSLTQRTRTIEAIRDDLSTRLLPKAWMIWVGTRWHEEDPIGSLLPEGYAGESGRMLCRDGMVWNVICLPAECERADDPLGRPVGDGAGGVPGSMLWPEYIKDNRFWLPHRANKRTWTALFQQRPRPDDGNMFEERMFKRYPLGEHPKWVNRYLASDYATQDGAGDFTEHGVWGMDSSGDLWALDWFSGQVETDVGLEQFFRLAKKWGVRRAFKEQGVIRRAIEPFFKMMRRKAKARVEVEYLPTAGQKTTKAMAFQGMANAGQVHIPDCPWGDALIEQLLAFPGRTKDDKVDVCGLIARALEGMAWSKVPSEPEPEPAFKMNWKWLTTGTEGVKKGPRYG